MWLQSAIKSKCAKEDLHFHNLQIWIYELASSFHHLIKRNIQRNFKIFTHIQNIHEHRCLQEV
jgi:hypothetical protein